MDISSGERWRTEEKGFNIVESELSQKFMYLRAILGHSGSTINPALQNNVLSPEGFTEFF